MASKTLLGIASLQRHPPDPAAWIRHHVAVGFTHFYIGLEDTPGLKAKLEEWPRANGREHDVKVHVDDSLSPATRVGENNYFDIMQRQDAWVDKAMALARADGVEWLFHIDDDELLWPRTSSKWAPVLDTVGSSCASVHMTNWEGFSPAQPQGSWFTDPRVKYMPGACAHLFTAYANGKSASRVVQGQSAWGPHHFKGGKECELAEDDGVVLHHDSLAMSSSDVPAARWVEKNLLRAAAGKTTGIPFGATRDAIDAVVNGTKAHQRSVWEKYRSQAGERFGQCPVPTSVALPGHTK